MSIMSRDEVARIAELARINLNDEQLDRFSADLEVIIESVSSISGVVTDEDVPPTSHPLPLTNVYRDDVPETPLDRDLALSQAPAQENGQFLVPQILGED